MQIQGNGKIHLSLIPYSSKDDYVTKTGNAVYIPSSNFNTIQLQIIISNTSIKDNLDAEYEKNDDTEYIFIFKDNHS